MDLSRLRRMVRARWWLVAVLAILGFVIALAVTNLQNDNIEPRYSATATIEFIAAESEEDSGGGNSRGGGSPAASPAAGLVETATEVAEEVNATLLENPSVQLVSSPERGTLAFRAVEASPETAEQIVLEMRDNYVAVDPTRVDVEAEISRLIAEAEAIQVRLAELEPPPPPEPTPISLELEVQLGILQTQIDATNGDLDELVNELEDLRDEDEPDEDEVAALEAQIAELSDELVALKLELAQITPPEPEEIEFELSTAEELEQSALNARLEAIGQQYQEFIDAGESTNSITLLDIVVEDETPAPTDRTLAALIGLLGGAIAGLVAIIFADRVQGTVWTPTDLEPMPVLAEAPQHASRFALSPRRYEAVRAKGVQSVRSAILGLFHASGPVTIGFTGLGTADESVSGLVLEVAQSLAGVGRSVLLVDGQIGGMPDFRDQLSGGTTLADLVADHADDQMLDHHVGQVLDGCVSLGQNLCVLPGDPRTVDAVDTLASKSFRALTEQALDRYDIVIVVGPSALSPFAYVMAGLVSAYIVVSTVGRTRQAHVDQLVKQFAGSRSRLIGSVLLGIRPRRGWVPASSVTPGRPTEPPQGGGGDGVTQADDAEHGLLDRLGQSLGALAGDKSDQ